MKKTGLIIGIVIAIVAIIAVVALMNSPKACGASNGNIDIHFYDANGNPICNVETLSTVGLTPSTGAKGVSYMALTVKAINGATSVPLTCYPLVASVNGNTADAFGLAMPIGTSNSKFVQVGQTIEWTSNQFAVSGYENSPTPDIFNVTVRCTASGNPTPLDATNSLPIYIQPDGSGSFTVQINPPEGIPSQYCGDGVCGNGETLSTCPVDCGSTTNVNFRTTDLTYVQGSAIGVNTGTCGGVLTKYGYESSGCNSATSADCTALATALGASYTRQFSTKTIPDSINTWSTVAPCLFSTSAGESMFFKVGSTTGEPMTCNVGNWVELRYTTASTYANGVSSQGTSFNSQKELSCP